MRIIKSWKSVCVQTHGFFFAIGKTQESDPLSSRPESFSVSLCPLQVGQITVTFARCTLGYERNAIVHGLTISTTFTTFNHFSSIALYAVNVVHQDN